MLYILVTCLEAGLALWAVGVEEAISPVVAGSEAAGTCINMGKLFGDILP